ncbi:spore germination protein [Sporosalibacterium faouarense]|uniref:spore germination protein n=1 Tax=Sporosalibacterium faouarense TaxID=516123 RepID=UPI00192A9FEB|nr:spore germination protein [Sporosalibacterium faouarense]
MLNKLKHLFSLTNKKHDFPYESNTKSQNYSIKETIDSSMSKNVHKIKEIFGNSQDFKFREISNSSNKITLLYINGLVHETSLNEFIAEYLSIKTNIESSIEALFSQQYLASTSIERSNNYEELVKFILNGLVVVLVEGYKIAYALNFIESNTRNIADSDLEKNLRGPRDAFIEDINTNIALIRKRIKSTTLQVDNLIVGSRTNTNTAILYIRDIANPKIVNEAKERLSQIDYDEIQDGTFLAHLVSDNPITVFPLMYPTEKPDRAASSLLQGKLILLSDNSPTAITLPTVFIDFLHVQDDFYERFYSAIASRIIRYIGAFLAVFSTPMYIALTSVNVDMLPTKLAIPFSQVRYVVPFPLIIEALIMEITLEILREAGLRIPSPIGPAISIVGGLVVGQTAVNAGLISPFLTIIVALSAIGSFTVTSVDLVISLRIIKFLFIVSAGIFGLYGLGASVTLLVIHCCSLTSFGVPYFAPFSEEGIKNSLKSLFRQPFILDFKRHSYYRTKNEKKVRK